MLLLLDTKAVVVTNQRINQTNKTGVYTDADTGDANF